MSESERWTVGRLLQWTTDYLKQHGSDSPRLDAEVLLAEARACRRIDLYAAFDDVPGESVRTAFRDMVRRRAEGAPVAYLVGHREFYSLDFRVTPDVLIPRPETELVAEAALERLSLDSTGPVLDLCTGSGCIAGTLAAERPCLVVVGTDASAGALEIARENARALGVAPRVELLQGDLEGPVAGRLFHLVVSNPPYVETAAIERLSAEVRREPRPALDGGPDGLSILRRIVARAPSMLVPGGWLVLEIGEEQGPSVLDLLTAAGLAQATVKKDLAGLDRIALARRP